MTDRPSQYDRFSNAKLIEIVETKLHTLREYQLRQLIETLDKRLAQNELAHW